MHRLTRADDRRDPLRSRVGSTIAAALFAAALFAGPHGAPAPALAQTAPPDLGAVIIEDTLTGPELVRTPSCPSGRLSRQFANEGYTITASGGCQQPEGFPGSGLGLGNRLTFADGEVSVDFRQISGLDRTQIQISLRTKNEPAFSAYSALLVPTRGTLGIGLSSNGQFKQLVPPTNVAHLLKPDDWNTLAFRAQKENLWVYLNGTLVMATTDATLDAGSADVIVSRIGQASASDTHEISAVLRNFRVSGLAGGERAPTYTPPPPIVTTSNVPCSLPTAAPTDVAMIPPDAAVDPNLARMAGPWEGVWDEGTPNALPSRLYVEQFNGEKVTLVYTWGETQDTRPGWGRIVADVLPDAKVGFGNSGRRFTFWAADDNTIEGTLVTAQFTSKVTLRRC